MDHPVLRIEYLNPELFTYDNYESAYWNRFDWDSSWDQTILISTIRERALGYCDGSRLSVRPNPEDYGVMFEDEYGKFWFHISKNLIDSLREGLYDEHGYFDAKKALDGWPR